MDFDKNTWYTKMVNPGLLGTTPLSKTHNMTFAVKANIGCGFPGSGSAATHSLRNWTPKEHSPIVEKLVKDGHQIAAITNMHELALGITSENPVFGDVDNPHKPGYIPGGSSGGSAVAVAINAVSFALGTDTGGSMLIPAALCGVVGYRPSIDLYSTSAVFPLSATTDTIGIFALHVDTIRHVHKTIVPSYTLNKAPSLSSLRIGVPRQHFYRVLDPKVRPVIDKALQDLRDAKVELVEKDFPVKFDEEDISKVVALVSYEAYRDIPKYLQDQKAHVTFDELIEELGDKEVAKILTDAKNITRDDYEEYKKLVEKIRKSFDDYFKTNNLDGFVCPTTILPALKRTSPKEETVCDHKFPTSVCPTTIFPALKRQCPKEVTVCDNKFPSTFMAYVHNTVPQAAAGVPCISLPCGMTSDDGDDNSALPVGIQLVAPRGMDGKLLDMAAAIQPVFKPLKPVPQLDFNLFN